ncbi:hypothetical protein [Stenoxybacter acetivorans]|uniref:hypothetical protein n=1 Tax=Stenoxybacter acetivorans TaxID=422441 RepID=UPI00055CF2A4|nr:hypothetical protein [Stenoxybacter acetivorans]
MNIFLITGWGMGVSALQPLQAALQCCGHEVILCDVFNPFDALQRATIHRQAAAADVLMGWSLGGQLAACLAQDGLKSGGKRQYLITLASNPCFVANQSWSCAMTKPVFERFQCDWQQQPSVALKRFIGLVCMGAADARADVRTLQNLISPPPEKMLADGLNALRDLDLTDILRRYPYPQYHLLAQHDALVPHTLSGCLKTLNAPHLHVDVLPNESHAFAALRVQSALQYICAFLDSL